MSKPRANITPEDIGGYYQDAKGEIWQLAGCEVEPHATMVRITDREPETKPISEFKDFVRLKPVVQRTRKVAETKPTRKTRSDAGKHRKSQQKIQPETADTRTENMIIHTPTGIGDDTEYIVTIAGSRVTSPETAGIRFAVMKALEQFGGEIPDVLNTDERKTIRGILGEKDK